MKAIKSDIIVFMQCVVHLNNSLWIIQVYVKEFFQKFCDNDDDSENIFSLDNETSDLKIIRCNKVDLHELSIADLKDIINTYISEEPKITFKNNNISIEIPKSILNWKILLTYKNSIHIMKVRKGYLYRCKSSHNFMSCVEGQCKHKTSHDIVKEESEGSFILFCGNLKKCIVFDI